MKITHFGEDYANLTIGKEVFEISLGCGLAIEKYLKKEKRIKKIEELDIYASKYEIVEKVNEIIKRG